MRANHPVIIWVVLRMKRLLAFLSVLAPTLTWAYPTSLNLIPIADILAHRQAAAQFYWFGDKFNLGQTGTRFASGQFGIADRFEAGFDNDFLGHTTYNLKFQAFQFDRGAISAGIMDWAAGQATPYVVGRYDFKGFRLHGGWMRDSASRLMLGADFQLPSGFTGLVDWICGPGGQAWFGFSWTIPRVDGLSLAVGAGIPLGHGPVQHSIMLTYSFRL
jgi:hypothetical protein